MRKTKEFAKKVLISLITVMMMLTSTGLEVFAKTTTRIQKEETPADPDPSSENPVPVTEYPKYVVDENGNYTFVVSFNDHEGSKEIEPLNLTDRPTVQQYMDSSSIYFSIDGGETYLELNEQSMAVLGLEEMPTRVATESNNTYTYTIQLPSKVSAYANEEDEDGTQYNVTYLVGSKGKQELTDTEVSGYLYDGRQISEDGRTITEKYTVMIDWNAELIWYDNNNLYQTRPSDVNDGPEGKPVFTVYRMLSGQFVESAVEVEDALEVVYEDGKWTLKMKQQPAYDENGNEYVYFLKPCEDDISKDEETGEYIYLISNKDKYASEELEVFINGTIEYTIVNFRTFTAHKVWKDKGANEENRPAPKLYLYRVAQNKDGSVTIEDISTASPVQYHDYLDVPNAGGNEFDIIFGLDDEGKPLLPMYDVYGQRYVYFALETGLSGDYHMITNNGESSESEIIKAVFDSIHLSNDDEIAKYLLDNGTITNIRKSEYTIDFHKEFRAISMQSMKDAAVRAKLQYLLEGETEWKDATAENIISYGDIEGLTVTEEGITIELSGFSQEEYAKSIAGPLVNKYDEEGRHVSYRWVETAIKTNGSDWVEIKYENSEYKDTTIGDFGPGINGDSTTVIFKTEYDNGNGARLLNILTGERIIEVKKYWSINGENISGDSELLKDVYITVNLIRTGNDGTFTTADGTLVDMDGKVVEPLVMTVADYNAALGCWDAFWRNLPRYDEFGREYTYQLTEASVVDPLQRDWGRYYELFNDVVEDEDGNKVVRTTGSIYNTVGEDETLVFDVEKQWLDDCDLLSRFGVMVGVFRNSNGECVASGLLSEQSNWRKRFTVRKESETETVADFTVREVNIRGVEAFYNDPITYMDYNDTEYSYDKSTGEIGRNGDGSVNTDLYYDYHIYIQRNQINDSTVSYLITNQRYAKESFIIKKTWVCADQRPDAIFELVGNGVRTAIKPEMVVGTEGSYQVITEGNLAGTIKVDIDAATSVDNTFAHYLTVTIKDVQKYDLDGKLIDYDVVEKGVIVDEIYYPFTNGKTNVNGDIYVSIVSKTGSLYTGAENHHTDDVFRYEGKNVLSEKYNLTAYKVWRDDGTKLMTNARPDVSFNLYRVCIKDNQQLIDAINEGDYRRIVEAVNNSQSEQIAADHYWNTKLNDWFWVCDMGTVDRYDNDGYPYLYYLKEIFPSGKYKYSQTYSNYTYQTPGYIPVANPEIAEGWTIVTTKEVFALDVPDDSDLCILADGIHCTSEDGNASGCGNYYSRTTVNTIADTNEISGRKIWSMPNGWELPVEERPELTIKLYAFNESLNGKSYIDEEGNRHTVGTRLSLADVEAFYNAGLYGARQITQTVLLNGTTYFNFGQFEKYDEYGRSIHYYISEEYVQNYSPEDVVIDVNDYHITNTYGFNTPPYVHVTVNKQWLSDVEGKAPAAPARFTLYASMTNKEGRMIGDAIEMATGVITPVYDEATDTYINSLTFTKYGAQTDNNTDLLPYYGPNGQPLVYWVEEDSIAGYISLKPEEGTTKDSVISLTMNNDYIYQGTVSLFVNKYEGYDDNNKLKDISLKKIWNDTLRYESSAGYRPDGITIELWRKWDSVTVDGVVVEGNMEGEPVEIEGGTGINHNVIVLRNDNNWTKQFTGLDAIAPNGAEYQYYLTNENVLEGSSDGWESSYSQKTDENGNRVNNIRTVTLALEKDWSIQLGEKVSAMKPEVFANLQALGVLPDKVALFLQRKTDDPASQYQFIPLTKGKDTNHGATIDGVVYCGTESKVTSINSTGRQFKTTNWQMPQYSADGKLYQYRVVERMTWADGSQSWFYGADNADNDTLAPENSLYKPLQAKEFVKDNGKTLGINNIIEVIKLRVIKYWNDNGNRDNTRPGQIGITVTTSDGKSLSDEILNPNADSYDTVGNYWYGDIYYLAIPNGTGSLEDLINAIYGADEGEIAEYTRDPEATDKSGAFNHFIQNPDDSTLFEYTLGNTLNNITVRELTDISAKKIFPDDSVFADVARATVRLILMYKPENGTSFVDVTAENMADVGITDASQISKIVTITDGSGEVSWTDLYRYWPRVEENYGIPHEIEYSVREELLDENNNVIDNSAYKLTSGSSWYTDQNTGRKVYTFTLTNSIVEKTITISKNWLYNAHEDQQISKEDAEKLINEGMLPEYIRIGFYMVDDTGVETDISNLLDEKDLSVISLYNNKKAYTFNLPFYDKNGKALTYVIKELAVKFVGENEFTPINELDGIETIVDSVEITSSVNNVPLVNEYYRIDISVGKKWLLNDNPDNIINKEIATLLIDEGFMPEYIKVGFYSVDGEGVETDLSELLSQSELSVLDLYDGNKEYSLNLPLIDANGDPITYRIKEIAVKYKDSEEYVEIENVKGIVPIVASVDVTEETNNVELINECQKFDLSIGKQWIFNNNPDLPISKEEAAKLIGSHYMPEYIKVGFYSVDASGEETDLSELLDEQELNVLALFDGNKEYSFNLPLTDEDGEPITYRIKEIAVKFAGDEEFTSFEKAKGIVPVDSLFDFNDEENEFTFTNSFETIDIDVTKIWEDVVSEAEFRPETITIILKADGEEVDSVELSSPTEETVNTWTYTFHKLPKYNKEGKEIKYTVEEEEVPETYTETVKGYVITNHQELDPTGQNWTLPILMALLGTAFIITGANVKKKD